MNNITIEGVPALKDNYIWVIIDNYKNHAVIVDPGEAAPILDFLNKRNLTLIAMLITHHHWDHVNGLEEIINRFNVPVYGPANEKIPFCTHFLSEDQKVKIQDFPLEFDVIEIPGHTSGHIAYYSPGILFCGDTLFAAGCGRVFEGTHKQMFLSLQKMAALPDETKVYCAHEYTLNNLRFAQTVEPENKDILKRIQSVAEMRNKNQPSLPSTLTQEKATNPFLRCDVPMVKASAEKHGECCLEGPVNVFAALRNWKDNF